MQVVNVPKRFGDHHNAFGFLRLLLASLVIVSHTPEIVDGNRKREILTRLFHTISAGELAVAGFFVISGFLITASFLNSSSAIVYVRKRVTRIYPGFFCASLLCVLIVAPLAGGHFDHGTIRGVAGTLVRIALLCPPIVPHVFDGTPYPALNGAAWTIQYEFFCYLIVLCLGKLGWLRSPWILLSLAFACLAIAGWAPVRFVAALDRLPLREFVLSNRLEVFRLAGLFLSGASFYLLQSRLPVSKSWMAMAFILLCVTLFAATLADLGCATFGAYMLFAAAALGSGTILGMINNRTDISYGLYLYAWPAGKLMTWWNVSDSLLLLGALTWAIAAVAGTLSWFCVEKPIMQWSRRRRAGTSASAGQ